MMEELRTLWHLLDIHDISIRPRYIESPANVWADRLGRKLDDADGQLNPRIFAYLQRLGRTAGWSVVAFRLPRRPGYTSAVAREAVQPSLQYGRDAYCRRFYGASPPPKVWSVIPAGASANGARSHGLCGDVSSGGPECWEGGDCPSQDHMPGGIFYTPDGIGGKVQEWYTEGELIDVEFVITAHHRGMIELRLCDEARVTQECLNKYEPLHRFQLPAGVTCERCVIQMWWVTANSCVPPGVPQLRLPRRLGSCGGDGGAGFYNDNGADCEGSTRAEEFWNCADVSIAPGGPTPSPTPAPTPAPTTGRAHPQPNARAHFQPHSLSDTGPHAVPHHRRAHLQPHSRSHLISHPNNPNPHPSPHHARTHRRFVPDSAAGMAASALHSQTTLAGAASRSQLHRVWEWRVVQRR
eukprot:jgi/Tetstr1/435619/TSEL_024521.t1